MQARWVIKGLRGKLNFAVGMKFDKYKDHVQGI